MTFQEIIATAPRPISRRLEQLKFLRERPDYHPEPSAFEHIKIVTERLIPTGDMNLTMAGIMHDICKFDTVKMNEKTGWPTSPGHDDAARDLIYDNGYDGIMVRAWLKSNGADFEKVAGIAKNHMRFHQLGNMRDSKREKYIQDWEEQGIMHYLEIFGAADNMLAEFDMDNLEKSWKFNEK